MNFSRSNDLEISGFGGQEFEKKPNQVDRESLVLDLPGSLDQWSTGQPVGHADGGLPSA